MKDMKVKNGNKLRLLLAVSVACLILYTVPAWTLGMVVAVAVAAVLAVAICRIPDLDGWLDEIKEHPYTNAVALLIVVAFGFNFFNMWVDSSYIIRIANMIGIDERIMTGIATAGVGAAAFGCVAWITAYLTEGVRSTCWGTGKHEPTTSRHKMSVPGAFALLSTVYLIGIYAIIRANALYQDDAARAFYGYKQWDYFGRFLSTAMASLVHTGDFLIDIAPLPQIIAMLIVAAAGVITMVVLYDRTEFTLWEVIAMIPLGLNPYFLECISFRFDAPYMAISVLAGIAPLLLRKQNDMRYILASILGILAVCTSYQSATGIFPVLVVLVALRMWTKGESLQNAFVFCLKSAIGYGIGLAYFKFALMRPAYAGYVSNALPPASKILPNTLQNLSQYYQYILLDFKPLWLILSGLLFAAFVYIMITASIRSKWQTATLTILACVLMLLLCFGIYPVLADTLFAPRAMYGFGVLLAFLCAVAAEGRSGSYNKWIAVMLSWSFLVFAFHYGNALTYQKEYSDYRIEQVLDDLNDLEIFCSEEPIAVQVTGSIGQAPILDNMPQNYQMLNRLIPETFGGESDLTQYRFFAYYDLRNVVADMEGEKFEENMPVLKDTMLHTIMGEGNRVLVVLK